MIGSSGGVILTIVPAGTTPKIIQNLKEQFDTVDEVDGCK